MAGVTGRTGFGKRGAGVGVSGIMTGVGSSADSIEDAGWFAGVGVGRAGNGVASTVAI